MGPSEGYRPEHHYPAGLWPKDALTSSWNIVTGFYITELDSFSPLSRKFAP